MELIALDLHKKDKNLKPFNSEYTAAAKIRAQVSLSQPLTHLCNQIVLFSFPPSAVRGNRQYKMETQQQN